jgi:hypothetical protein
MDRGQQQDRDSRPIPDPTILTTQQLNREVASMKELFDTRLGAMDKAVGLLQAQANRSPTIGEVYAQHEERFKAIAQQFSERDTRTEQTSRDSKVAVDAALQAQKESVNAQNISNAQAIAKSEAAFTKQIDQIGNLIQTMAKGIDDKIDDMKERITTIESRGQGIVQQKQDTQNVWGYVIGAIGVICVVITVVVLLLSKIQLPH